MTGSTPTAGAVTDTETLQRLQVRCRQGYVDPALMQYAVKLVSATRNPAQHGLEDLVRHLSLGASPRASIQLVEGARALAFLRGRGHATPQDMMDLAPDVLRHRLVLSYEALSEGLTADAVIARILKAVTPPVQPLHHHVDLSATTPGRG
ncbi:MAG: hypothetical protein RJA69_2360, partial [Pseudomonadota bacterium]